MMKLNINCHNEASLFKASRGYLMRLTAEQALCPTGLSNKVFYFCRFARLPRHFVPCNDRTRGAMFGLCRALKKQSSELFLASRHSVDSQETRGSVKATRGAMFGLDARIALAIFGALSVISGAALYSAIQNAKTERYWQDFREIIKATEQYYLDNGKTLPQENDTRLHIPDLLQNRETLSLWNGPYISGVMSGTSNITSSMTKEFASDSYLYIWLLKQSSWVGNYDKCDIDSLDCYSWVVLYSSIGGYSKVKNLFSSLDEKIDNSDGVKSGSVRMSDSGTTVFLFVKGMPQKRIV